MSHTNYLQTQVLTASPYRLHLMVVDGAIRHALRAEQAIVSRDFETSHAALNKSRDLVAEMLAGLDERQAPDLVAQLKSLFVFVHRKLVEADLRRDQQSARDALKILEMHRETWLAAGQAELAGPAADAPATGRSWTT
jgi:flagellar secretion chaperone FliS